MKLFKYEGYNLTISEEALTLKPFRDIWVRDKSKNKERATQELAFIYFMEDPRSDYQYMVDIEERAKAIKEGEGLSSSWLPDKLVEEAREFYSKFKTTSALLLEDTRFAVERLRSKLRNIDLDETDDKGRPIYTLNTIVSTIKQVPALIKDLDEAERALAREIAQSDKARGSLEKAMYEDL